VFGQFTGRPGPAVEQREAHGGTRLIGKQAGESGEG
jgi:hypothetical protein